MDQLKEGISAPGAHDAPDGNGTGWEQARKSERGVVDHRVSAKSYRVPSGQRADATLPPRARQLARHSGQGDGGGIADSPRSSRATPPHLAVVALLFRPDTSDPSIYDCMQALQRIRRCFDAAYERWEPHVTLLPPFVVPFPEEGSEETSCDRTARIGDEKEDGRAVGTSNPTTTQRESTTWGTSTARDATLAGTKTGVEDEAATTIESHRPGDTDQSVDAMSTSEQEEEPTRTLRRVLRRLQGAASAHAPFEVCLDEVGWFKLSKYTTVHLRPSAASASTQTATSPVPTRPGGTVESQSVNTAPTLSSGHVELGLLQRSLALALPESEKFAFRHGGGQRGRGPRGRGGQRGNHRGAPGPTSQQDKVGQGSLGPPSGPARSKAAGSFHPHLTIGQYEEARPRGRRSDANPDEATRALRMENGDVPGEGGETKHEELLRLAQGLVQRTADKVTHGDGAVEERADGRGLLRMRVESVHLLAKPQARAGPYDVQGEVWLTGNRPDETSSGTDPALAALADPPPGLDTTGVLEAEGARIKPECPRSPERPPHGHGTKKASSPSQESIQSRSPSMRREAALGDGEAEGDAEHILLPLPDT